MPDGLTGAEAFQNPIGPKMLFARMRYTGESERIVLDHKSQIFEMREKMAASGMLASSSTVG